MQKGRETAVLEGLKVRIQRLERLENTAATKGHQSLPFGLPAFDRLWPEGGLPVAALHEVAGVGVAGFTAATAFAAALAGRRSRQVNRTVLWCTTGHELYPPGLAGIGLSPGRLMLARARTEADVLAVMEEGLRHRGLAGVIGEVAKLDLTASRRLQLAAEKSGVMVLVVRKSARESTAISAASRWRIAAVPSAPHVIPQAGRARWKLELIRARSGHTGCWIVEAPDAQGYLGLSSQVADRSADTALRERRRLAG